MKALTHSVSVMVFAACLVVFGLLTVSSIQIRFVEYTGNHQLAEDLHKQKEAFFARIGKLL